MIRGKLYATGKKKFEFEEFAQQKQLVTQSEQFVKKTEQFVPQQLLSQVVQ